MKAEDFGEPSFPNITDTIRLGKITEPLGCTPRSRKSRKMYQALLIYRQACKCVHQSVKAAHFLFSPLTTDYVLSPVAVIKRLACLLLLCWRLILNGYFPLCLGTDRSKRRQWSCRTSWTPGELCLLEFSKILLPNKSD